LYTHGKGRFSFLRYVNARDVLPPDILSEVQKYLCGELIYIPKRDNDKAGWGQINGTRSQVVTRNRSIAEAYYSGASVYELMDRYCLSEASIRKIIYNKLFIQELQTELKA
jgi:Mor family transcriptional regulator